MVALWGEGIPQSDGWEAVIKAGRARSEAPCEDKRRAQGLTQEGLASKSMEALWLNNWYKPDWVDSQVAVWGSGMSRPPSSSVRGPFGSELTVAACRKLCEDGQVTEAVHTLNLLVQRGSHIPYTLFYRVLKRCTGRRDLALGRRIHALTVESGYGSQAFLANHLICMYASHGSLGEAMQVFSKVPAPDVYVWASIILAYARHGQPSQALGLYRQMQESTVKPDNHIFAAVLTACAIAGDWAVGKEIHAHILASAVKPDIVVQTCLVDMYAKCGSLKEAQRVFDRLPQKNVVTWNAMISGYAQQGMGQEALSLYASMQQEGISLPGSVTFVCLLQACASLGAAGVHDGKQLHAHIHERGLQDDVMVGASLVNMYAKCGSLEDARRVFDSLPQKNVVTWNAMIDGYAQEGMGREALSLYTGMQRQGITPPDRVTFVCLLQACSSVGVTALQQGKQIHALLQERGLEVDVVVSSSLVDMYAKCGSLEDARRVFDRLPHIDVVTWNAMIAGYAQQGRGQDALTLYINMQQEGITSPSSVTFVSLLQACASLAALPLGKQLHAHIEERGLQADMVVGNSLVNMYAKCGSLEDAQHVFDSMPEKDVVTWNAMIAGHVRLGNSEVVFDLVHRMRRDGMEPDDITLLSVLTVCSHIGSVDKGREYFDTMTTDYDIIPTLEHYTCMVDVLGRAGKLDEALVMVKTMPFQPNSPVWRTLLAACRKWNNVEVGRQAFESAVRLDEKDPAPYVLMSSIYAGAQMWEDAKEMRARRVGCGAWKEPGRSWWTDRGGVVHTFVVGDKKHPESEGIYARLERLLSK